MKNKIDKLSCLFAVALSCAIVHANAQPVPPVQGDSLRITIQEAEKIFAEKNLSLLAQKYNIDIAKAQVIQAKLYNNPNFSVSTAIYNPEQKKYFDVSKQTGEYAIGLQQMVILAAKRNKQIKLAETNTVISEQQFYNLLRTLRFSLRSDFNNLYYLQNSLGVYDKQITSLEKLDSAYHDLQAKGVVTLKDAIRIRSLLYSLKAEQVQLQSQVNDVQAELRLLLQANRSVLVAVSDSTPLIDLHRFSLQELIDTAYNSRSDLELAKANVLYSQQNYALQKSLRIPDLSLGAQFDKRGSYLTNASLFNAGIDLPIFNRNQGNIKASKIAVDQNKILFDLQTQTVENDVQKAYINMMNADKMLQSMDTRFRDEFEKLLQGVTINFEKKNISLLEFTDFYDAYKTNVLQYNQLRNEKMQAVEALNFAVGKTVFNY